MIVSLVWAAQHVVMPLTFNAKFITFQFLSSVPFSLFITVLYLRLRRVIPLAVAHSLMDGLTVLLPLFSA